MMGNGYIWIGIVGWIIDVDKFLFHPGKNNLCITLREEEKGRLIFLWFIVTALYLEYLGVTWYLISISDANYTL